VTERVRVAVAVVRGLHVTQGVDRVAVLFRVARVAGGFVRMLDRGQHVVGVEVVAAGRGDAVDVLRFLVGAGGQVGLGGEYVVVAVVGVLDGLIGAIGGRAVGVGGDGLSHAAQGVVVVLLHDAARVGHRVEEAGGRVGVSGDEHGVRYAG